MTLMQEEQVNWDEGESYSDLMATTQRAHDDHVAVTPGASASQQRGFGLARDGGGDTAIKSPRIPTHFLAKPYPNQPQTPKDKH